MPPPLGSSARGSPGGRRRLPEAPATADQPEPPERTLIERVLGLVTEVRHAEVPTALLLTLNVFLLLTAYGCIKPAREALILALPAGAEYKIYMSAGIAAVLLVAVPLYARVAIKLTRNRLVIGVTAFFASHLLVFYALGSVYGSTVPLALGFYLWIGIFDLIIVAQFWAFANDLYAEEAGQRLFPLIGLGAAVGAVAGSALAKTVIPRVGTMATLLVAAGLLLVTAVITQWVHVRESARTQGLARRSLASIGDGRGHAFRMVFQDRYLLIIALLSLLVALVKTNGEYILAKLVGDAARQASASGEIAAGQVGDYIGGFYANFLFYVDIVSLVLQALVVSRLVKYLGFGLTFLVLPLIALVDAAASALWPLLWVVQWGKMAENATNYSVFNTVRNMLWLPTSRRAKYLAKQAVDSFFVRMGGVLSAVLVFAGAQLMHLRVRAFAIFDVVLVALWIVLARTLLRERAKLTQSRSPR